MTISDLIESFIRNMIEKENGATLISRNELANYFNCVPSQINYVLTTRFTTERGYEIESRRGGGGFIKIRRVQVNKSNYLMHILNSIRASISSQDAQAYVINLLDYGQIDEKLAKVMIACLSDKSIPVSNPKRDEIRAMILKNMIISML